MKVSGQMRTAHAKVLASCFSHHHTPGKCLFGLMLPPFFSRNICVWNKNTGKLMYTLTGHTDEIEVRLSNKLPRLSCPCLRIQRCFSRQWIKIYLGRWLSSGKHSVKGAQQACKVKARSANNRRQPIIIHLITAPSFVSQEARYFPRRSRGKHQDSRETKLTVIPREQLLSVLFTSLHFNLMCYLKNLHSAWFSI